MAQRRMFSSRITNSGRFLTMSPSAQNLYFHLGMRADDDGVVEAHTVIKLTDSKADDYNLLVAKRFIYPLNDDLVVVILDWREHNLIRPDRKIDSIYKELLKTKLPQIELLETKPRADTGKKTTGRPLDNQLTTNGPHRLGKVRIGKDRLGEVSIDKEAELGSAEVVEVINAFKEVNSTYRKWFANKTQRASSKRLIDSHGKEQVLKVIAILPKSNKLSYVPTITTPLQLEDKWASLEASLTKKKAEAIKNQPKVIW